MEAPKPEEIYIEAKRIGDVPGTHTVTYDSTVDSIELKHTAHNREGFALGAVIAAEWLAGKKGIYTMKDVLNLESK
jgi:4-hydroxy-tetrahydrodipicolinate reductase